jgi:hypothetical protein
VKVWAVADLKAQTLLHHSECSSVTDAGSGHQSDGAHPHRECWHTCMRV